MPGIGHGGWLGDAVSGERLAEATRALQLESDGAFAVSAKAAASAASAASAATSSAATGLGYALNSTATAIGGGVNATAAAIGGGATGLSSYVGATAAAIGSTFARFPLGDFFVAPPPPPPPSLLDLPTDLLARVVSQSPPLAATAPPPSSPRRARVSGSSRPVSGPSRPAGPSSPAARTASRKASTSFRITRTRPASAPKADETSATHTMLLFLGYTRACRTSTIGGFGQGGFGQGDRRRAQPRPALAAAVATASRRGLLAVERAAWPSTPTVVPASPTLCRSITVPCLTPRSTPTAHRHPQMHRHTHYACVCLLRRCHFGSRPGAAHLLCRYLVSPLPVRPPLSTYLRPVVEPSVYMTLYSTLPRPSRRDTRTCSLAELGC